MHGDFIFLSCARRVSNPPPIALYMSTEASGALYRRQFRLLCQHLYGEHIQPAGITMFQPQLRQFHGFFDSRFLGPITLFTRMGVGLFPQGVMHFPEGRNVPGVFINNGPCGTPSIWTCPPGL